MEPSVWRAPLPRPSRPPHGPRGGPLSRVRRVLAVACAVALAPVIVSFVATMLEPSNSSFGIRAVEWVRDHGAAGVVTRIESVYYSLQAPSKGGPALRALPKVGLAGAGVAAPAPIRDRPARIRPLASPALPGEGVWHAIRAHESSNDPPLLLSTFRSDPSEYPRLVAGVAWINTSRTSISICTPGRLEPSVPLPSRGPMQVPVGARGRLLATFNSGFKLADARGGWALNGHTYAPMRDGQATFVRRSNGSYDVIDWRGGPRVPADVVFARQNLPLIVDDRRPNPLLSDGPGMGAPHSATRSRCGARESESIGGAT